MQLHSLYRTILFFQLLSSFSLLSAKNRAKNIHGNNVKKKELMHMHKHMPAWIMLLTIHRSKMKHRAERARRDPRKILRKFHEGNDATVWQRVTGGTPRSEPALLVYYDYPSYRKTLRRDSPSGKKEISPQIPLEITTPRCGSDLLEETCTEPTLLASDRARQDLRKFHCVFLLKY